VTYAKCPALKGNKTEHYMSSDCKVYWINRYIYKHWTSQSSLCAR